MQQTDYNEPPVTVYFVLDYKNNLYLEETEFTYKWHDSKNLATRFQNEQDALRVSKECLLNKSIETHVEHCVIKRCYISSTKEQFFKEEMQNMKNRHEKEILGLKRKFKIE